MKRILKWTAVGIAILVGLVVAGAGGTALYVQLAWDMPYDRAAPAMVAPTDAATVAHGRHLYENTLLCWICHGSEGSYTPDEPQAGGREFDATEVGPGFGFFYGSNLTSDAETGIGDWSDGELVRALREGLDRDGRLIFPVMEAEMYKGLSDRDALAVVAYLRTLEPVSSQVPANRFSLPAKALMAFGVMAPQPPITTEITAPREGLTAEWGEYLAWRRSGCAGCHMPRDPSDGHYLLDTPFAGSQFPIKEPQLNAWSSNLTPHVTGLAGWAEEDFLVAMQTGVLPDGKVMATFMPWPAYSRWPEQDLRALWRFFRTLEPMDHPVPDSELRAEAAGEPGPRRGEGLYQVYCINCHGPEGRGSSYTAGVLADSIGSTGGGVAAAIIAGGIPSRMPGFDRTLDASELLDVVAYLEELR